MDCLAVTEGRMSVDFSGDVPGTKKKNEEERKTGLVFMFRLANRMSIDVSTAFL